MWPAQSPLIPLGHVSGTYPRPREEAQHKRLCVCFLAQWGQVRVGRISGPILRAVQPHMMEEACAAGAGWEVGGCCRGQGEVGLSWGTRASFTAPVSRACLQTLQHPLRYLGWRLGPRGLFPPPLASLSGPRFPSHSRRGRKEEEQELGAQGKPSSGMDPPLPGCSAAPFGACVPPCPTVQATLPQAEDEESAWSQHRPCFDLLQPRPHQPCRVRTVFGCH